MALSDSPIVTASALEAVAGSAFKRAAFDQLAAAYGGHYDVAEWLADRVEQAYIRGLGDGFAQAQERMRDD